MPVVISELCRDFGSSLAIGLLCSCGYALVQLDAMAGRYAVIKRFAIKRMMETNIRGNSTVGPGLNPLGSNELFSPRESSATGLDFSSGLLQRSRDRRSRELHARYTRGFQDALLIRRKPL